MPEKTGLLGVDLGGTNVRAALLTEGGEIIARKSHHHGEDKRPPAVFQNVKTVITAVLQAQESQGYQITTLGIGVPGSIDNNSQVIVKAPNLGWENVDFLSLLCAEYPSLTITLANDLTMAVWGEFRFGAGRGYKDIVFVALGTGVGGGVILDGKVLPSMEVGHMVVEPGGEVCGCTNSGCWETIVSGSRLQNRARRKLREYPDSSLRKWAEAEVKHIPISAIYKASKHGDTLAVLLWEKFINYLAYGINNIVVLFDPQLLILGGGVTAGLPQLVEELRPVVKKTVKIFDFNVSKLTLSQLGEEAGLVGAALYGCEMNQQKLKQRES